MNGTSEAPPSGCANWSEHTTSNVCFSASATLANGRYSARLVIDIRGSVLLGARLLTLLAAAAAAVALVVSPASAITGNFQKDTVHTYVGLVAFYDADSKFLWRCTG